MVRNELTSPGSQSALVPESACFASNSVPALQ